MTRAFWLIPERLNSLRTLYIPVYQRFTRLPSGKRNGKMFDLTNQWRPTISACQLGRYFAELTIRLFHHRADLQSLVLLPWFLFFLAPEIPTKSDPTKNIGSSSRLFTFPILYTLPSAISSQKTSKVKDILRLLNLYLHPHHLFCASDLYINIYWICPLQQAPQNSTGPRLHLSSFSQNWSHSVSLTQ